MTYYFEEGLRLRMATLRAVGRAQSLINTVGDDGCGVFMDQPSIEGYELCYGYEFRTGAEVKLWIEKKFLETKTPGYRNLEDLRDDLKK